MAELRWHRLGSLPRWCVRACVLHIKLCFSGCRHPASAPSVRANSFSPRERQALWSQMRDRDIRRNYNSMRRSQRYRLTFTCAVLHVFSAAGADQQMGALFVPFLLYTTLPLHALCVPFLLGQRLPPPPPRALRLT